MMSEGQIRLLLATLKEQVKGEKNTVRVLAFSGGVSALQMVLEEDQ